MCRYQGVIVEELQWASQFKWKEKSTALKLMNFHILIIWGW